MADEGSATAANNHDGSSSEEQWQPNHSSERKLRFPRACTSRSAANRMYQAATEGRRSSGATPAATRREKEERQQRSKIITPLAGPPPLAQLPRWSLRSMWEFASLLNFLHVSSMPTSICDGGFCCCLGLRCWGRLITPVVSLVPFLAGV